jgi:hypothetical protein
MRKIARWTTFLILGLPFQLLTYILYPFVALYFRLFIRRKHNFHFIHSNEKVSSQKDFETVQDPIRNTFYLDDDDSHTAMVHGWLYGIPEGKHLAYNGLQNLITTTGSLHRRIPDTHYLPVSGDCLSSWVWAYIASENKDPDSVELIATHYLKNCLGLEHRNGKVSARSSNSGVNLCYDGYKGLNQPAFGPQYYTSASIFALAKEEVGGLWHLVYWVHFLVMGGWLWWVEPIIHSKNDMIYYAHDITMKNLWSLQKLNGYSCLNDYAMQRIKTLTFNNNPFFVGCQWSTNSRYVSYMEKRASEEYLMQYSGAHGFVAQHNPDSTGVEQGRFKSPIKFMLQLLSGARIK